MEHYCTKLSKTNTTFLESRFHSEPLPDESPQYTKAKPRMLAHPGPFSDQLTAREGTEKLQIVHGPGQVLARVNCNSRRYNRRSRGH